MERVYRSTILYDKAAFVSKFIDRHRLAMNEQKAIRCLRYLDSYPSAITVRGERNIEIVQAVEGHVRGLMSEIEASGDPSGLIDLFDGDCCPYCAIYFDFDHSVITAPSDQVQVAKQRCCRCPYPKRQKRGICGLKNSLYEKLTKSLKEFALSTTWNGDGSDNEFPEEE